MFNFARVQHHKRQEEKTLASGMPAGCCQVLEVRLLGGGRISAGSPVGNRAWLFGGHPRLQVHVHGDVKDDQHLQEYRSILRTTAVWHGNFPGIVLY